MSTSERELFRVRDIARAWDVHELTIRRWIASGKLEAVRLGEHGPVRVSAEELDRFMRAKAA